MLIGVDEQPRLVCSARLQGIKIRRQVLCRIQSVRERESIHGSVHDEDYRVNIAKRRGRKETFRR